MSRDIPDGLNTHQGSGSFVFSGFVRTSWSDARVVDAVVAAFRVDPEEPFTPRRANA
jgi:hypothetical protein